MVTSLTWAYTLSKNLQYTVNNEKLAELKFGESANKV